MLYTEEAVRANIRNREGKRVFYLGKGDTLTPGARDYLSRERIEVLPAEQAKPEEYRLANGAVLREKPEHMTHLKGNLLMLKTHPRIALRGRMDSLEAELLLCQLNCEKWRAELGEILALARNLIRWEVLDEPVPEGKLCGLTAEELRSTAALVTWRPQKRRTISAAKIRELYPEVDLEKLKEETSTRRFSVRTEDEDYE